MSGHSGHCFIGFDQTPPKVAEQIGPYYVYALADPSRANEIFYVGKGTRDRFRSHLEEARRALESADRDSPEKLARIREIYAQNLTPTIFIVDRGLDQKPAFRLEAILIETIPTLTNQVAGHGSERYKVELRDLIEELGAPDLTRVPSVPALLVFLKPWVDERDDDLDRCASEAAHVQRRVQGADLGRVRRARDRFFGTGGVVAR